MRQEDFLEQVDMYSPPPPTHTHSSGRDTTYYRLMGDLAFKFYVRTGGSTDLCTQVMACVPDDECYTMEIFDLGGDG